MSTEAYLRGKLEEFGYDDSDDDSSNCSGYSSGDGSNGDDCGDEDVVSNDPQQHLRTRHRSLCIESAMPDVIESEIDTLANREEPPSPLSQTPLEDLQLYTSRLLEKMVTMDKTDTEAILRLPFPFFVFGTLRLHHQNNVFMGLPKGKVAGVSSPFDATHVGRDHSIQGSAHKRKTIRKPHYNYWSPAFVPHTACEGLSFLAGSDTDKCMGELFYYSPNQYEVALPDIDMLESFDMSKAKHSSYVRMLMWCYILPWSVLPKISNDLSMKRIWMGLPKDVVDNAVRIPAWVYSNNLANATLARLTCPGDVIIWGPNTLPKSSMKSISNNGPLFGSSFDLVERH